MIGSSQNKGARRLVTILQPVLEFYSSYSIKDSLFGTESHQKRLDTRSIPQRPVKVGIRGGEGRERAEARTLLVYVAHQLT